MTTTSPSSDGTFAPEGPGRPDPTAPGAGRVLPHSLEAEVCVLGSMILDNNTIDIVVHILRTEDFFRPAHRILFDLLCGMHGQGKPIDLVTLNEELQRGDLLKRVGGTEYLVQIVNGVPTTANSDYYARLVRDKALLRSLIAANQQVIEDAYASQDDPAEILDRSEYTIFEISSRQISDHAVGLDSLMQQTFEMLSAADGSITGLPTGYYKLDDLTCGLQASEMIVLAARPSMGKTALACNLAEFMAIEDGKGVLLFSLEMAKEQLAMRFLCSHARFSATKARRGNINSEEWMLLQAAAGDLEKAPIFIDDSAELNILQLRAKARRLRADKKISCVILDYLQLMGPLASARNDPRHQQIADMSRGLKALARELKIPIIVLSQLNRASEGREGHRPRMSDLRESGAIEQDADVVMLLHREDYYHRGEADYEPTGITDLIIAKQRNGPVGMVPLTFLPECVRFENCATDDGGGSF